MAALNVEQLRNLMKQKRSVSADEWLPAGRVTHTLSFSFTFYAVPYRAPVIDASLLIAAKVEALRRVN